MTTVEFLRERYHAYQALSREEWRRAVMVGILQRMIADIAADFHAGNISLDEAAERAAKAAGRIDALPYLLTYPLEERMN